MDYQSPSFTLFVTTRDQLYVSSNQEGISLEGTIPITGNHLRNQSTNTFLLPSSSPSSILTTSLPPNTGLKKTVLQFAKIRIVALFLEMCMVRDCMCMVIQKVFILVILELLLTPLAKEAQHSLARVVLILFIHSSFTPYNKPLVLVITI